MPQETPPINEVTTHKWRIANFSQKAARTEDYLFSGEFPINGTNGIKGWIQFEPTNSHYGSRSSSSIRVGSDLLDDQLIATLDFTVWIENTLGERIAQRSSGEFPMARDYYRNVRSYYAFVHHDALYESDFIRDDVVFICWEIRPKSVGGANETSPTSQAIHEKLSSLYFRGVSGSCTIQIDDRSFTVDKASLAAASSVFEAKLLKVLKRTYGVSDLEPEPQPNADVIEIRDVSAEQMECFIEYLNTHRIHRPELFAEQMWVFADEYDVSDLKEQCVKYLVATLNRSNAIQRLLTAFAHNNEKVREAALAFITRAGSNQGLLSVIASSEWQELLVNKPPLASQIMTSLFGQFHITPKAA